MFTGYLRAVRSVDAAAAGETAAAVSDLRAVAREPSAPRIAAAARGARIGAKTRRAATAALASMRPSLIPVRVHERLLRWSERTARGLRMVARGLKGWPFADAAAGRRVLRRAADTALAWQGATRRIAARRGAQLPGWVRAQTLRARALAHTADVVFRPVRLTTGAGGAAVRAVQGRLAALGYLQPGYAPGVYDYPTMQATIALQGWEGIARDGVAGPSTLRALRTAARPVPWSSDTRHMEVHKAQQVLLLVENGTVVRAIHVSTAAPGHVTPDGTFTIYRKERMSWSVPFHPASHGCIRVPAGDSVVVWDFAVIGTPITIG